MLHTGMYYNYPRKLELSSTTSRSKKACCNTTKFASQPRPTLLLFKQICFLWGVHSHPNKCGNLHANMLLFI